MKPELLKKAVPHVLAFLFFVLIVVMFFGPVFFESKSINQHDILQWEGGAKELIDYREKTGEEGLWANSMFSGMPAYLVNTQWSNQPVRFIQNLLTVWMPHPVSLILLGLVSTYITFLIFGTRSFVAAAGAVSYSFSSYIIVGLSAGHNSRIGAIAMLPLIVGGIHLAYKKNKLLGFAVTATALALQLRFNHLQITYYTLLIVVIYGAFQLIEAYKGKLLKEFFTRTAILVAAAVLGLCTFLGTFWATYEYSQYSIRGKSELTSSGTDQGEDGLSREYAFRYSSGVWESMTLFIPNILGGSSGDILASDQDSETYNALRRAQDPQQANQLARFSGAYWGDQPYTSPYYAGAIAVFLLILGFFYVEKPIKYWLLASIALGIMLSWGKNFSSLNYLLFDILPGYNKFRSVTFAILIAIFGINLLGYLGLEAVLKQKWAGNTKKRLLIATGAAAGLCLLLLIGGGSLSFSGQYDSQLPKWFTNALQADRLSLLRGDALRTMAFVLASAGLIFVIATEKLSVKVAAPLLVVLVTIDHWFVDRRYFGEDNFQRSPAKTEFQMTEADQVILNDTEENFRVYYLPDPWNNARTSYYHHSLGGYHGAKMRRYQDLIERCLNSETETLIQSFRGGNTDLKGYGTLNMLNTRYLLANNNANGVIRNPHSNGSAWLVSELIAVSNPDEEIERLCSIDTKTQAVINTSRFQPGSTTFNSSGTVTLKEYQPSKLIYEASLSGNSFIVFSEIYYPKGWKAYIDEEEVEIMNVNYVLRGLEVASGTHRIEFRFEPAAYYVGNKVMAISSYLLVFILLGSIGISLRKTINEDDKESN